MHLKFLDRGTGSAAVAAAYLLADKDAAGKTRASVEVLRGDPNLVAAVADGLSFKHRYTSGVCAWSAEDAPTRTEIERFVDEFEKTAWSGLDPERYAWSVVVHRDDDGGVHLHTFAARCDLATGLSLNIAPPGWGELFDPLRDAFNWEYGWSRPDDPARARPWRPAPGRVHRARAARRSGEDVEPDPREQIGKHLLGLVAAGQVKDRAGVVAALKECGYDVPREGRHYVTARNPETGERWRLKGALYERGFDGKQFMSEAPERSGDRERADGGVGDASSAAAEAWEAVEDKRRRRAEYHRKHYGLSSRTRGDRVGDAGSGVGDDAERESGSAAAPVAGRDTSLAAHLQRELGNDAVVAVTESAESTRDRSPDAGAGRGERGLVPAAALAEAIRAAGPDLSRALSEHVAIRERVVRATSMGEQWLADAQQEVVKGEDGLLTVGERAHAVETVEGQIESDSRRESELQGTSLGPGLLREVFGERGDGDARLSFAARARGLEQVEQRVRNALTVQEGELRSIPFGRQYLSEESQSRSGDAEGVAAPLPEWESRVRRVEQRAGEELDRLKKEHVARAGNEDLLVAAARVPGGDSRTLSLRERWETYQRAESRFEEEQRELDRAEAAVRKDPAGEEFLRHARLEVLGTTEREATLAERARIVKAASGLQKAAAAKREAEAKQQAEQKWKKQKNARVQALDGLPGGLDLYHAHLADLDPEWDRKRNARSSWENIDAALAAAESDGTRLGRLRVVLSDKVDATRYREELGKVSGQFKTSDLDRALAAAEREREERETRLWEEQRDAGFQALSRQPGGGELYDAHLADLDPQWDRKRNARSSRENIDAALAAAGSDAVRLGRLRVVLSNEVDAVRYGEELGKVAGQFKTSDLDRVLAVVEQERETRLWEEQRDTGLRALERQPGGLDLYRAHLADLDPQWDWKRNARSSRENIDAALAAAGSDAVRLGRLRVVLSNEVDAARYGEELDKVAGQFKTSDVDSALAAAEQEREKREKRLREEKKAAAAEKRVARIEQLFAGDGGDKALISVLDAHKSTWRETGTGPADIDTVIDVAEVRDRAKPTPEEHAVVVDAERVFAATPSAAFRQAGERFSQGSTHARVVRRLADRALVRALAVERREEPPVSPTLVQRLFTWLRDQIDKLLDRLKQKEKYEKQVRLAADISKKNLLKGKSPLLDDLVDLVDSRIFSRLKSRAGHRYLRDTISEVERDQSKKDANHPLGADYVADARDMAVQDHLRKIAEESHKILLAKYKKASHGWFGRPQQSGRELPPTFDVLMQEETKRHESELLKIFEAACDQVPRPLQQQGRSVSEAPAAPPEVVPELSQQQDEDATVAAARAKEERLKKEHEQWLNRSGSDISFEDFKKIREMPLSKNSGAGVGAEQPALQTGETPTPARSGHDWERP